MTAVVAINPNQIFEDFTNGTKAFIREAPVVFKATTEQKPAPAFVLNDVMFIGLQSYVKSALKIPKTDELFKATYPFEGLNLWIQTQPEYDQLYKSLIPIHEHCETFLKDGINPMIGLALQEEAQETNQKLMKITEAIGLFKSQTESDAAALKILKPILDEKFSEKHLDSPMTKHMEETRECIRNLIKNQQQTVMSQEYLNSYKWLWDFPGVGGLLLPWASEDMKEALRNYVAKYDKYKIMVAQGDQERAHLLKSIDTARGLIENIDGVMNHLDEAKKSLDNIFDGMVMMNMSCSTLRKKLESIDGNVKTEAHGSSISKLYISMAVTSWNNVLEVARSFAKHGIIEEATDTNTPTRRGQAVILAASYGGQTVTDLAKMQLNYSTKIVISTKDLIFPPGTLKGKPKALSILYRFGDDPDSWRTFTCDTGTEQVHTLTADNSHGSEVAVNFRKDKSSRYKIHAIVYGLRQITDKEVLNQVASSAEIAGALLVNNASFCVNSSNDPWLGKLKTAAIFYTVDGVLACASGIEGGAIVF
ncbi:uncharacterized protein FOBCDRAFT_252686 [Fusarium oxysporum Fo47]|uniref:uncharacterized protein n=1 Tax=Fusarium oxysporum Fo47 TaxID=660027 RepID=UPI002869C0F7|nr:uncharacterized protein FOBCDRAFT_252686 [Fusarium oxysporum Fo47]QKD59219.2 hypothetical protein FOBCDRAFT_252686 [Fusarium oxysporum Fo47]